MILLTLKIFKYLVNYIYCEGFLANYHYQCNYSNFLKNDFSHRVFNAYVDHRERRTENNRTQPSFSTMASRITAPEDVPSHICPRFDDSNKLWIGRNVVQYKQTVYHSFYIGKPYFSILTKC